MVCEDLTSKEKLRVQIYKDSGDASFEVAQEIIDHVRKTHDEGRKCVLGLATGSSPSQIYRLLIREHKEKGLSFKHVITFNLDEYYPMDADSLQSYHRFMKESLFDHIDIDPANCHLPDGTISTAQLASHCEEYEAKIRELGPIDIQLLGLGRTGHIGFNEQGSSFESTTRMIYLDQVTRTDAAADFFSQKDVPKRAITMGLQTIMQAKRILLVAFGENKAKAVLRAVEGEQGEDCAASVLQRHCDAVVYADTAASAGLTRVQCPWTVAPLDWTEHEVYKAVIWLARTTGKAISRLVESDYNAHHLQGLLIAREELSVPELNSSVLSKLQSTIVDFRPSQLAPQTQAESPMHAQRSQAKLPCNKTVLIMSPHPDDDVISCGGTFIHLVQQNNEVHVAYQTSGNVAVSDEEARRHMDFSSSFNSAVVPKAHAETSAALQKLVSALDNKQPGQVDSKEVLMMKTLIRYSEAKSAARVCGADVNNLHFLDMPFYQTGKVTKNPLSREDVLIVRELFRELKPHHIYAAGDLSDPHGTHRTCLQAIVLALEEVKNDPWFLETEVWLYRGAWQEFEADEIEMAIPMSPEHLAHKIEAIFRHQSQKDRAMFPGADNREFWQRARDRNKATAELYNQLGLPEYEAMEAFVRYNPDAASPFFSKHSSIR